LLLRLDTRGKLDDGFQDRLEKLADSLTDKVSDALVCPCVHIHLFCSSFNNDLCNFECSGNVVSRLAF